MPLNQACPSVDVGATQNQGTTEAQTEFVVAQGRLTSLHRSRPVW